MDGARSRFSPVELARNRRMVEEQIRRRGIRDERVLAVMEQLPRTHFIPPERRNEAFEDRPVPIGYGQTISQPYIVALMTEALEVQPEHEVLEIGTGCGYQTAILAQLARRVYTMEYIDTLARQGRENVETLGLTNVEYRVGDGHRGWPEEREFDRILVAAAAEQVPERLWEQLVEGGKMVIPVGPPGDQRLLLLEKQDGARRERLLCYCRFVKLVGGETPRRDFPPVGEHGM